MLFKRLKYFLRLLLFCLLIGLHGSSLFRLVKRTWGGHTLSKKLVKMWYRNFLVLGACFCINFFFMRSDGCSSIIRGSVFCSSLVALCMDGMFCSFCYLGY